MARISGGLDDGNLFFATDPPGTLVADASVGAYSATLNAQTSKALSLCSPALAGIIINSQHRACLLIPHAIYSTAHTDPAIRQYGRHQRPHARSHQAGESAR